ncbi:DUF4136 domain-containing protein [Neotamlana laminarinivorans]|uniref:DUF4136 domain-containing protein n=1 Tax=Neotamlana laminarinivorans TaxID=2883124 RepID=A0A9X1I1F1_9FLAO|nr:DUF4136 domain-containing protein [Tamlana laminarinivorans]MCB4799205.1 DUF4136 domain-containing protein [Tamlana laminarinivorans]
MRFLLVFLLAITILSCATVKVDYDYDSAANFNNYKTYNYYADMKTGFSELDTNRLLDAIDSTMTAKGFYLADSPDFFIDIKSEAFQAPPRQTVGVGVGGGGGHVGGGISIGIPVGDSNFNRVITIDFVDENKKQLFWQAVAETKIVPNAKPEKREALFYAIAEKILANYPPEH